MHRVALAQWWRARVLVRRALGRRGHVSSPSSPSRSVLYRRRASSSGGAVVVSLSLGGNGGSPPPPPSPATRLTRRHRRRRRSSRSLSPEATAPRASAPSDESGQPLRKMAVCR